LRHVDTAVAPPETFLGVLGGPGLTAYAGLLEVAGLRDGDVVWVCGAAQDPAGAGASADPDGAGPAAASPDGNTTLADKHMPASCRSTFGT